MANAVINAAARGRAGKGAARAARREGKVPGVVYGGDEKDAQNIAVDSHELTLTLRRGRFFSTIFDLDVGGTKSRVIPRAVQLDPVRDFPIHVDFQRIGKDNRVRIQIPVRFVNEPLSPGLKRGGVLNIVRREIEVWAPADKVPEFFEANLDGLEIGRSIHISAIKLPEGVRPTIIDRDFTVATIAGAAALKPDFDDEATVAAAGEGVAAPGEGAAGAAPAAAAGGDAAKPGAAAAKPGAAGAKAAAPAKDDKKK